MFHVISHACVCSQGFRYVAAGPMVRSSYRAGEFYMKALLEDGGRDAAAAKTVKMEASA